MNLDCMSAGEIYSLLETKKQELERYSEMLSQFPIESKLGYWSLSAYIRKLQKQINKIEIYITRYEK